MVYEVVPTQDWKLTNKQTFKLWEEGMLQKQFNVKTIRQKFPKNQFETRMWILHRIPNVCTFSILVSYFVMWNKIFNWFLVLPCCDILHWNLFNFFSGGGLEQNQCIRLWKCTFFGSAITVHSWGMPGVYSPYEPPQ